MRKAHGVTQEELGKALGWEQSNVSKLERGLRKLTLDEIAQIADAIRAPIAALIPEWFEDTSGREAEFLAYFRQLSETERNSIEHIVKNLTVRPEPAHAVARTAGPTVTITDASPPENLPDEGE